MTTTTTRARDRAAAAVYANWRLARRLPRLAALGALAAACTCGDCLLCRELDLRDMRSDEDDQIADAAGYRDERGER